MQKFTGSTTDIEDGFARCNQGANQSAFPSQREAPRQIIGLIAKALGWIEREEGIVPFLSIGRLELRERGSRIQIDETASPASAQSVVPKLELLEPIPADEFNAKIGVGRAKRT